MAQELAGRALGLKWGIVAPDIDPEGTGRIKVFLGHQGGHNKSNWLIRIMPWFHLSVPMPSPGDIVLVGFNDANQNEVGFYLGFAQNLVNPAGPKDVWRYEWGTFSFLIAPVGSEGLEEPEVTLTYNDASISFKEEYVKVGYLTSAITFYKDHIDITSPKITFGQLNPDGTLSEVGGIEVTPDTVNFTATNVTIDEIPVTVIGAVDSDGDHLVTDGR